MRRCAALLKLRQISSELRLGGVPIAEVTGDGKWKYVLVQVSKGEFDMDEGDRPGWVRKVFAGKSEGFVVDQRPCTKCDENGHPCDRSCYHKALTRPTCDRLEEAGYKTWMTGGGWIDVNHSAKTMHITGVSIALGPGDHQTTQHVLQHAFPDYTVTFETPL
eukprot:TRINITY_DN34658_c0_g1_i1.p1 TRINITY_DN34658_c0_g1~~TRINITY_DN34658_c0_g1_i1.p1  ORF type:complete len:162 (+),score=9.24 TRINITY_DN34658_c0_g1_i1:139-624(+)